MAVGPTQILIIALIVLLLFGAGRIAEIGKGLGQGIRNFKKGLSGEDEGESGSDADEDPKQLKAKSESKAKRERKRDASEA